MLQSNPGLVTFFSITYWLMSAIIANPAAEGFDCPTGAIGSQWSFYAGPAELNPQPCYAYHRQGLDWWTSVDVCREATAGHLVAPKDFLDDWNGPWGEFWIDGWKEETEWEWIDGVKLGNFSRWESNPRLLSGGDCAYLETSWPQREFTWVQQDCSAKSHFICQTTTDNANCSDRLTTISFEGLCFLLFPESLVTWHEASDLCRDRGATLAAMQLREVYETFEAKFLGSGQWEDGVKSREDFWIGLRRSKWISTNNGDEIPLSLWGSNGPSAAGQCAYAVAQVGRSTASLYGSQCNVTRRFVCDINSTKGFEVALGLAGETPSSSPISTTPGSNEPGSNAGQIVGLVILVVLVIVAIVSLVLLSVCLWRRFHQKRPSNQPIPRSIANRRPTHELFCTSGSSSSSNRPSLHPFYPSSNVLSIHPSADPAGGSALAPSPQDRGSKTTEGCVEGGLNAQSLTRNDQDCVDDSCETTEEKPMDLNDAANFGDEDSPTVKHEHLDLPEDIFSPMAPGACDEVRREDVFHDLPMTDEESLADNPRKREGLDEKSNADDDTPSHWNVASLEVGGSTDDASFA